MERGSKNGQHSGDFSASLLTEFLEQAELLYVQGGGRRQLAAEDDEYYMQLQSMPANGGGGSAGAGAASASAPDPYRGVRVIDSFAYDRRKLSQKEMRKALKNARHVPVVAFVFRSGERAPPQTDAVMQHLVGEFGRRAMVVALPSDQELINLEKLPAPEFMGDGDGGEGDRELVSVDDILDELAEANDSAEEEEEEGDSGSSSSSLEGVVMVVATPKGKGRKKRQIGIGAG